LGQRTEQYAVLRRHLTEGAGTSPLDKEYRAQISEGKSTLKIANHQGEKRTHRLRGQKHPTIYIWGTPSIRSQKLTLTERLKAIDDEQVVLLERAIEEQEHRHKLPEIRSPKIGNCGGAAECT
jgi:hypothetical protein